SKTDTNAVRCPEESKAQEMFKYIDQIRKEQDTIGGVVTGVISSIPVGLGEPLFNKLNAAIGHAMLSINAVKGFELGSGFEGVEMRGSSHNDVFEIIDDKVETKTNFSGGIQGGISNGQDIYFNVAFKPVATIMQDQSSVDKGGNEVQVKGKGRHDPCVVPRAVPIVEAMSAIVMTDFYLLAQTNILQD
ncbi:MAG: chorismate synthase, partial [Bacteroidota bacterium]